MSTETEQQSAALVEGHAIAGSAVQLAAEIRSQREMALSNPRDERKVMGGALAELNIAPEFAKRSFYVIPYKDYSSSPPTVKNVEGPSVKASRALARRWGNCATASRVSSEDDERYQVEGIFVDFETNVIFRRTVSVSKFYIPHKTKVKTPLRDDRLTLALQAGMSKAERNATLAALPVWLVDAHYAEARRLAAGGKPVGSKGKELPIAERYDKMYAAFAELKIERKAVADYIQRVLPNTMPDPEIIGHMIGIFNAIKDGQVKAQDVFAPESAEAGKGPVNLGDVLPGVE